MWSERNILESALLDWCPSAVVFDCDGLLVDTEPCWTVAETEVFTRRGLPFGAEQKALVIGKSVAAAAETMAEVFGEPGRGAQIAAELLVLVEEIVGGSAVAMDGASDLIVAVAKRVPVAVASNSPRGLLNSALRRARLSEFLPISVAADEVHSPKPAPEMYLAACRALGVAAAGSLAFEDSLTGLRSARAAGLRLVGIPTLHHDEFPADLVIVSLLVDRLHAWIDRW